MGRAYCNTWDLSLPNTICLLCNVVWRRSGTCWQMREWMGLGRWNSVEGKGSFRLDMLGHGLISQAWVFWAVLSDLRFAV